MKIFPGDDRRRFERYETDLKIDFYVNFDIRTRIDYRIKASGKEQPSSAKYGALSKNISVEGLCFTCSSALQKEDVLLLEVFLPSATEPIAMEGVVKWVRPAPVAAGAAAEFETGVKVLTVNGEDVEGSVHLDKVHKVIWSIVLESVFGDFKHLALKRRRDSGHS
ncbi:MAG: PilZ domain-containing protein [Candidatus Omnitrophota bacterium]|nr:PilZ domain-containing protein [Candidatus Omnitrophota bacterium]